MRKLALHLAIACSTFGVSTCLTNIWTSLGHAEVPAQRLAQQSFDTDWRVSPADPALLEIYRDYASAQTAHDRGFFERVETEDFVLFLRDGKTLSRNQDIELLNSGGTDIVYKLDDLNAEIYGDGAIVTGRITASFNQGYSYSWHWIDVCVRRGGRWQIQSTTQLP